MENGRNNKVQVTDIHVRESLCFNTVHVFCLGSASSIRCDQYLHQHHCIVKETGYENEENNQFGLY